MNKNETFDKRLELLKLAINNINEMVGWRLNNNNFPQNQNALRYGEDFMHYLHQSMAHLKMAKETRKNIVARMAIKYFRKAERCIGNWYIEVLFNQ